MEQGCYELLFKGPIDNSDQTFQQLSEVLCQDCGFTVVEVTRALTTPSAISVVRSPDQKKLEVLSSMIRDAGGKVLLVNPWGDGAARTLDTEIEVTLPSQKKNTQSSFKKFFEKYTNGVIESLKALDVTVLEQLVNDLMAARADDRQIFIIGNGGSAATASHMANDFAKERFDDERSLFRVMSLTDNVSLLTATANDFGYDSIFLNQLKSLMRPGDLVIAISSSGNSESIIKAVDYANRKGAKTWGVVGFGGGKLKDHAQALIDIPSKRGQYGYMEDVTSIINHLLSVYIYEQDCKRFARS